MTHDLRNWQMPAVPSGHYSPLEIARFICSVCDVRAASWVPSRGRIDGFYRLTFWDAAERADIPADIRPLVQACAMYGELSLWARDQLEQQPKWTTGLTC